MRLVFLVLVLLALLASVTAVAAVQPLIITQPSANETLLAEMRDFYVYWIFTGSVPNPGDIRIEVYAGDTVAGVPVRVIQSQVDPVSGITNASVMNGSYCTLTGYCTRSNGAMVPDLVESPGGILDPTNKVVVTNRYYLGQILGGVTKGFDTNYTSSTGTTLVDLSANNYTIRVMGLSGSFAGQEVNKTITLGPTNAILGAFRPPANKNALTQYGITHNRRIYFDWFPGYFTDPDNSGIWWESPRRWTPNNGIEVVNDRPGTLIDKPPVSNNSMFIYNINSGSATCGVELAAILKYGLVDGSNTTFLNYDIGEPTMTYNDASAGVRTLTGNAIPVPAGKRLVLTRTESFVPSGTSFENLYDPNDATTPKTLNFNPSGGVTVTKGNEFVIYGVTKPIASTVTASATPYRFTIDNRIARINCTITDSTGALVSSGMHDVNLSRPYNVGDPTRFNSLWEFGIEVTGLSTPGTYTVSLAGVDVSGTAVAQTATTFPVTVTLPVTSAVNGESDGSSSPALQSAISPGTHAGSAAVFTFSLGPASGAGSVVSVALTPTRDIGQVQCIVQPVTPGAALQIHDRDVAGYELITVNWINPYAIGHADIAFTVETSWLDAHSLAPDQVVMMHYTGNTWVELPTRIDHRTGDRVSYTATTPGFSYFAIAGKSRELKPQPTNVTAGISASVTLPATTETIPTGIAGTTVESPVVAPANMTMPAEGSSPSEREIFFPTREISLLIIIVWAVVIILLLVAIVLLHRWWVRRQNPALFRRYD